MLLAPYIDKGGFYVGFVAHVGLSIRREWE